MAKRIDVLGEVVKATIAARERIESLLSTETTLADELFGPSNRDDLYGAAFRAVENVHRLTVKAWAKETGARAEMAWTMKDRAEAIKNAIIFGRCIKVDFLSDLESIEATARVLKNGPHVERSQSPMVGRAFPE